MRLWRQQRALADSAHHKLQMPNTKSQRNPKIQTPSFSSCRSTRGIGVSLVFVAWLLVFPSVRAEDKAVSFYSDVMPVFKRSCTGCHHPGKLKGQLDLTTYEAAIKG